MLGQTRFATARAGQAILLSLVLLAGCASIDDPFIPEPVVKSPRKDGLEKGQAEIDGLEGMQQQSQKVAFYKTPNTPAATRNVAGKAPPPVPVIEGGEGMVASINLENMPIPQFINAIFGAILKRNVSLDAQVAQRSEMVTFLTGKPQSANQIYAAAQSLLRSYGIAVNDYNGTVRAVPENSQSGLLPEIRRGRAAPEVPAGLRPVFYFVELEHTVVSQVTNWLRTLFPGRLTIQEDMQRNALLLSGQSDTVSSAMEAIQLLDQPLMRGRMSARIVPVFWTADEMARRLSEVLQAEGYSVGLNAGSTSPIIVLPVPQVNSIIVFASDEAIVNHVLRWAQDLDQTPERRNGNFINYHVRNTDASDLAQTLREIMGMGTTQSATAAASGSAAPVVRNSSSGKVVVNPAANSLIIQTTPSEFQQWYGLLQELDRPARSALIMATVAEVRLTDDEQFGFQWMLKQFVSNGYNINMGTSNPVSSTAAAGTFRLSIASLTGDPRALLTALASSNKIRILSNPSIMARNGQEAQIQVGQEVPILTSQLSNSDTGSSTGGVLQSIQYRNTGVILKVKPVIHAGGRIDLDVSQEVSAAQKNETGVDSSPIILTRKVNTKLSVSDGNTLLLGGLIQEQRTLGNAGIPYLKDIPYAGNLFKTSSSDNTERTELVILLTSYVVEDDFDAQSITDVFRKQFAWASTVKPESTFTKLGRGLGFGSAGAQGETQVNPEQPTDALAAQPGEAQTLVEESAKEDKVLPVKPQKAPAPTYSSRPYILPPDDGNSLRMSEPVAPAQQPSAYTAPMQSPKVNSVPAPMVDSAPMPSGKAPEGGKPVADDALKRELLESFKRSGAVVQ